MEHHYDLGNDFYAAWLDSGMTYSSAVFAEPISKVETLEAAQERKIRLLLDRLKLKPRQRLLEIGCGWGSLAEIAADGGADVHAHGGDVPLARPHLDPAHPVQVAAGVEAADRGDFATDGEMAQMLNKYRSA